MANKANKAVPTPVKKAVKVGGVKIRHKNDARGFFSEKGTQPLNDVWSKDKDGNEVLIKGLSIKEKIQQGYIAPKARRISFKKTDEERAEWRKVHTNAPHRGSGAFPRPKNESKSTLIAHFINVHGAEDFKTTRAFKEVKASELYEVLRNAVKVQNNMDVMQHVSKYFYAGKTYVVTNGQAKQV